MKKLISNTGGLQTFFEIRRIDAVPDTAYLRITTTFAGAKDPTDERVKFDAFLTKDELTNLKSVLDEFVS